MIQFPNKPVFDKECFLSREAVITVDGEDHTVDYLIMIHMDGVDTSVPTITEILVEGIFALDDYAFASNLPEEEQERRYDKRDHVYKTVSEILSEYYKVKEVKALTM
jgi:hypothetical protein